MHACRRDCRSPLPLRFPLRCQQHVSTSVLKGKLRRAAAVFSAVKTRKKKNLRAAPRDNGVRAKSLRRVAGFNCDDVAGQSAARGQTDGVWTLIDAQRPSARRPWLRCDPQQGSQKSQSANERSIPASLSPCQTLPGSFFLFCFYPGRSDEKRNEVEGRKINRLRGKKRAAGSKNIFACAHPNMATATSQEGRAGVVTRKKTKKQL